VPEYKEVFGLPSLSERVSHLTPSVTLAIDARAKQMKQEGIDVVAFGVGEPDFDTPAHIREAGIFAIEQGFTRYTPNSGIEPLRQAICNKLRQDNLLEYTPSQILVSNGAKHSIYNAILATCSPGDEVIIPSPYWVSYPEMVKLAAATPVIVKTTAVQGFKMTPLQLEKAITSRTKAVIINSPSNPTGMIYTEEELRQLAAVALEHDIFIISDEIYEKLIYEGKHFSIASISPEVKDLTITVNGVSKAYAMTGWRIGYAAGRLDVIRAMGNIQSHSTSNTNSIAQKAALAALTGPDTAINAMVQEFVRRRDRMTELLSQVGPFKVPHSAGAFYVFASAESLIGQRLHGIKVQDDVQLASLLLEQAHVALVPGSAFGAPGFLRLSYATSMPQIELGIERIRKFITET
jgi:aspartate aminotransferase